MRFLQKFFILLAIFSAVAFAQVDSTMAYDQFTKSLNQNALLKGFSAETVLILVAIIILAVLAIVFYEIHRTNKVRQGLLAVAWKKFDNHAEYLNLSQNCIAVLREIVLESSLQDPSSAMKSPHIFESSLEKYYENKRIESIPSEKLANIRSLREALGFLPLSRDIAFVSTRQFNIDEKCIVQIPDSGPATHKGMCLVQNMEERYWSITRPEGPKVPAKTKIYMSLTRAGDAEYTFKTQVLKDSGDELILEHVSKLNRAQQRNWVRIDVSIPVEITQKTNKGIGDIFEGRIIDMSGGGFGMALPAKLSNGDILLLNFELPGQGIIKDLHVKVVRVAGQYNNDPSKIVHSVAFEGEVRLVQEQIIQYVFEKQRQNSQIK